MIKYGKTPRLVNTLGVSVGLARLLRERTQYEERYSKCEWFRGFSVTFEGYEKLDGTNCAVRLEPGKAPIFTSRNRVLSLDDDHYGFARAMRDVPVEDFDRLTGGLARGYRDEALGVTIYGEALGVTIYGEWFGRSIGSHITNRLADRYWAPFCWMPDNWEHAHEDQPRERRTIYRETVLDASDIIKPIRSISPRYQVAYEPGEDLEYTGAAFMAEVERITERARQSSYVAWLLSGGELEGPAEGLVFTEYPGTPLRLRGADRRLFFKSLPAKPSSPTRAPQPPKVRRPLPELSEQQQDDVRTSWLYGASEGWPTARLFEAALFAAGLPDTGPNRGAIANFVKTLA